MSTSLRLHHQHARVRLTLESADRVSAFGRCDTAVNALSDDAFLQQVVVYGVDGATEQRKDDDLACCLFQDFLKHTKARC